MIQYSEPLAFVVPLLYILNEHPVVETVFTTTDILPYCVDAELGYKIANTFGVLENVRVKLTVTVAYVPALHEKDSLPDS